MEVAFYLKQTIEVEVLEISNIVTRSGDIFNFGGCSGTFALENDFELCCFSGVHCQLQRLEFQVQGHSVAEQVQNHI